MVARDIFLEDKGSMPNSDKSMKINLKELNIWSITSILIIL